MNLGCTLAPKPSPVYLRSEHPGPRPRLEFPGQTRAAPLPPPFEPADLLSARHSDLVAPESRCFPPDDSPDYSRARISRRHGREVEHRSRPRCPRHPDSPAADTKRTLLRLQWNCRPG